MRKWLGMTENRELIIHGFPLNGGQVLFLLAVIMEIGYFLPWYFHGGEMMNGFGVSMRNMIYFCTMLCPIAIGAVFWVDGKRWGREKYVLTLCLSFLYFLLLGCSLIGACRRADATGKLIWLCLICSGICLILSALSLWFNCEEQKVGQKEMGKAKGKKICSFCGTVLDVNAKFCKECGNPFEETPIEEKKEEVNYCAYCGRKVGTCVQYCVHCGIKLEEHALYCPSCGKKVERCHE